VGRPRRPRPTLAQKKALAENEKALADQKAAREAQWEAEEKAHQERLAAGWTTDGFRDYPPKPVPRPQPERKKITDDPEWQRQNKANRERSGPGWDK
jgi:hypothetical protein